MGVQSRTGRTESRRTTGLGFARAQKRRMDGRPARALRLTRTVPHRAAYEEIGTEIAYEEIGEEIAIAHCSCERCGPHRRAFHYEGSFEDDVAWCPARGCCVAWFHALETEQTTIEVPFEVIPTAD